MTHHIARLEDLPPISCIYHHCIFLLWRRESSEMCNSLVSQLVYTLVENLNGTYISARLLGKTGKYSKL